MSVVLIVEDDALIRMSAVELVLSQGYQAIEATSADAAIRILESRSDIDLVFTDVQMPGTMDGIKLTHHIRDRWPPVKLLVASGAAILDESSLPTGSRFFPKPYSDDAIVEAMARLLASPDDAAHEVLPGSVGQRKHQKPDHDDKEMEP